MQGDDIADIAIRAAVFVSGVACVILALVAIVVRLILWIVRGK